MNGCVTCVDLKNFNRVLCEFQQLFYDLYLSQWKMLHFVIERATCLLFHLHVWDFEDKKMDNAIRSEREQWCWNLAPLSYNTIPSVYCYFETCLMSYTKAISIKNICRSVEKPSHSKLSIQSFVNVNARLCHLKLGRRKLAATAVPLLRNSTLTFNKVSPPLK